MTLLFNSFHARGSEWLPPPAAVNKAGENIEFRYYRLHHRTLRPSQQLAMLFLVCKLLTLSNRVRVFAMGLNVNVILLLLYQLERELLFCWSISNIYLRLCCGRHEYCNLLTQTSDRELYLAFVVYDEKHEDDPHGLDKFTC